MFYSEGFIEFRPTIDLGGGGSKKAIEGKLVRTVDQFMAEAAIDASRDRGPNSWTPRLCDLGLGETSEHVTLAGANYLFTRLDYQEVDTVRASRYVAEILPGSRTEVAYWAKAAPEKQLAIHKGAGAVMFIDPIDRVLHLAEFDGLEPSETTLPSGVFYTLLAKPESDSPFVISGLYTEPVDWGTLETVVQPGDTMIITPDGILQVPVEFQAI